ncbi:MAG: CdiA family toxin C-terminal domain-containing protein [Pseudomonadota bacterium]|nr:CdiA family toxin C-terminal domain-containing protein [Pseudomonadota bacterium]
MRDNWRCFELFDQTSHDGAGHEQRVAFIVDGIVRDATCSSTFSQGLAYRLDLPNHLFGPDGFTKSGQLSGTHNAANARTTLASIGAKYSQTPTSTRGIYEIRYSYVNSKGKVVTGEKTVYDPKVISDQKMLDASLSAGKRAFEILQNRQNQGDRVIDLRQSGINFRIYLNTDPKTGIPYIGNIHPIK